jgi:alanine racemase
MAEALSAVAGKPVSVHVDVDTGMGRSGFPLSEAREAVERIDELPRVELAGVFTHFASADEDPDDARVQHKLFLDFLDGLAPRATTLAVHASNSPASLVLGKPGFHTLIRPGLLIYGIEPAPGMLDGLDIRPVLSIRARVTLCRDLPPGSTISYGKTYTVPSTGGRYATVAVGYGDGLPRPLGNVGSVLLHGRPAPIRGRVCMDQIVVDVTDIDGVRAGDVATVVGVDGESRITVGDVAGLIQTTPHLISTCLLPRLPRIPT